MKKVLIAISVVGCLFASSIDDKTLIKMKNVKQNQELAILNLSIEHEELTNQNLKLAQRIHDLEKALNNCCGNNYYVSKFDKNTDIKPDDNIKRNYVIEEKDIVINNQDMIKNCDKNYISPTNKLNKDTFNDPDGINKKRFENNKLGYATKANVKNKSTLNKISNNKIGFDEFFLLLNKKNIEEEVVVSVANLNIRELPTTSSKIIGTLAKGEKIKYSGVAANKSTNSLWLKADKGYIFANYTTFKKNVEATKKELLKNKGE